jgi:transcriptional regulator GlxA family with amidase domain
MDMTSKLFALIATLLIAPSFALCADASPTKLTIPASGTINVAFVISDDTTLIDLAGPMQTFDQAQTGDDRGFHTYTVSEDTKPIKAGTLTVTPDFTFANAPDADIVVVGAQLGDSKKYLDYYRRMNARGKLMLSVCTGVSKFAAAGILDGKQATTHHDFVDTFQTKFPNVTFVRDRAWVQSAPTIFTAGGETSGIDLALHIIELYFDRDVALKTARYMEYRGPDWQR